MVTNVTQLAAPDFAPNRDVPQLEEETPFSVVFLRNLLGREAGDIVNVIFPQGNFGYRPQQVDLLEHYGHSNICGYLLVKLLSKVHHLLSVEQIVQSWKDDWLDPYLNYASRMADIRQSLADRSDPRRSGLILSLAKLVFGTYALEECNVDSPWLLALRQVVLCEIFSDSSVEGFCRGASIFFCFDQCEQGLPESKRFGLCLWSNWLHDIGSAIEARSGAEAPPFDDLLEIVNMKSSSSHCREAVDAMRFIALKFICAACREKGCQACVDILRQIECTEQERLFAWKFLRGLPDKSCCSCLDGDRWMWKFAPVVIENAAKDGHSRLIAEVVRSVVQSKASSIEIARLILDLCLIPVCEGYIGELVKVLQGRRRLKGVLYEESLRYLESYSQPSPHVRGIIQMLTLVDPVAIAGALVRDRFHQAELKRKG